MRYGQGHTSVVKPFIVVEGYNTSLIAPHLIGDKNKNNDIQSFLASIDPVYFASNNVNFNDALQTAGYDLVYIDFRDGADDIRRNAFLFELIVRQVNRWKYLAGSTEKNVVMGESMGGLVARYGLAQLVRGGEDPQTRLLVLHDSPQRGAYSPMGLQALTRQTNFPIALTLGFGTGGPRVVTTSELSDKVREGLVILAAPATQQLTLKNVTGINDEYTNNTFIDGPYKDMTDFSAAGGPPATFPTIIATSDGSQCGRAQNTPVYQELTRDDHAGIFGASYLLRAGFQAEAVANALPAYGQQDRIAHLRIWFTIRVLWLRLDITLLNRNYTSPAYTLPYETLPGGTTNLHEQQSLTNNYDHAFLGFWVVFANTTLYDGDVCFVPSYSALDVPTVATYSAYAKYINNSTDNPNPPRVASYLAMESTSGTQFNQSHLRFTARNSEWIYAQMQNDPVRIAQAACTTECSALSSISGPYQICEYPTSTFSVNSSQVTWTASPSYLFTTTSGSGSQFSTAAAAGQQGTGTITATLACGGSVSKTITVGPAEPSGYYNGPNGSGRRLATVQFVPAGQYTMFMDQPYTFTFTSSSSSVVLNQTSGSYTSFYLPAGQGVSIRATASGAGCGYRGTFVFSTSSGYGYMATPNPSSSELTVAATDSADDTPQDATTAKGTKSEFTADLYDTYGKKVKTKRSAQGKAVLNVRDLPEGLYNLRVGEGKNAYSEHIQITH